MERGKKLMGDTMTAWNFAQAFSGKIPIWDNKVCKKKEKGDGQTI